MPRAQVISFLNMKGGVGKTTCAVNLATYLAKDHQKRVLLVDLDPQTNASLSVMPEKAWEKWAEEHGTMADVLEVQWKKKNAEHAKFKECIVHDVLPEVPGLDLVPSHLSLTFLDLDLAARPGRERIFGRKLEKVVADYDLIVCDCAPNLMTGTQNALLRQRLVLHPDAARLPQFDWAWPVAGPARLFKKGAGIQNPLPRRDLQPGPRMAALSRGDDGAPA
jgi:chromosome partitioning protein